MSISTRLVEETSTSITIEFVLDNNGFEQVIKTMSFNLQDTESITVRIENERKLLETT